MKLIDSSSGGNGDEPDVNHDEDDDTNDVITANHSADYIFGEEGKENEGDDDLKEEICSEVEGNDIAPSRYSPYGNGDPLRGATELLTIVYVEKKNLVLS